METQGRILVVDDEANARTALAELLRDEGYSVEGAADGFKALGKLAEFAPDLVLTDLKMPGMDGIELLEEAQSTTPTLSVVVMTAFGAVETAVARDAGGRRRLPDQAAERRRAVPGARPRDRAAAACAPRRGSCARGCRALRLREHRSADSRPMQAVFKTVAQVAAARASVLITGETGTGKELIAAAIHEHSPRAKGPFVKLHCAALAESLLESELFGHEQGRVHRARRPGARAASSRPTAARCSSTRSARSRRPSRSSCCASCRSASSSASAATRPSGSTCASSPRPTGTSSRWSRRGSSARTSTIA